MKHIGPKAFVNLATLIVAVSCFSADHFLERFPDRSKVVEIRVLNQIIPMRTLKFTIISKKKATLLISSRMDSFLRSFLLASRASRPINFPTVLESVYGR
jgi:hypothetical protein